MPWEEAIVGARGAPPHSRSCRPERHGVWFTLAAVPYEVQTPVFEGPFDLLLHLILREQVDLYELRLSVIVDAYLAQLERLEGLDLDVATEFLLIAATLVELKAKRLLPGDDDVDLDEELALWEERDLLLARLLECKTFKDAALALSALAADAGRSYPAPPGSRTGTSPSRRPPRRRHRRGPAAAFLRATAPKPVPRVELEHVAPIRASVTDAVEELLDELPRRAGSRSGGSPSRWSRSSRSSCGSSPCSSCTSRVSSTSTRPAASATSTSPGSAATSDSSGGAWMSALAGVDAYDG